MNKNKINIVKMHCLQRTVWQNGGSNPADTTVRIWKFVPRSKFSESRHFAKPRGVVRKRATVRISAAERHSDIEKVIK